MGPDRRHFRLACEWNDAREKLVEDARKRVHVCGRPRPATLDHLGGEVVDRAEQLAGLGQPGRLGRGGLAMP